MKVCLHVLSPAITNIRAIRVATALAQAGFTVNLIDIAHTSSRSHEQNLASKFLIMPKDQEMKNVHVRHIFLPVRLARYYEPIHTIPWLLFKAVRMILAILTLLGTSDDIYHASDLTALPACYIAALVHRKPLILELYDMPLVTEQVMRLNFLYLLSTHVLKLMMARCSAVISPSPPMAQEIQRRFGGKQAIVLRNIPPYQLPATSDRLRKHLDLGPETRIVLYQGNLRKDRGLGISIRAARFLDPNIMLILLGKGEAQAELQRLIEQEGVTERVKILPPVPYAELLHWTASADIGLIIFPPDSSLNLQMCLPNKLFEYLMAGVPVLASPIEAIVEVINAYQVGRIIPSLEPAAIAVAINATLAKEEARIQMRINALAASQHELNWTTESHKLIQLYRDVLPEFSIGVPVLQNS